MVSTSITYELRGCRGETDCNERRRLRTTEQDGRDCLLCGLLSPLADTDRNIQGTGAIVFPIHFSHNVRKNTFGHMRQVKILIRLRVRVRAV